MFFFVFGITISIAHVLGQVPIWYELLEAHLTLERSNTNMLPKVNFQVWSSVVAFIAFFIWTIELVYILMSFQVVSQNPLLFKLLFTSWVRANVILVNVLSCTMSSQMVTQVLCHLKRLFAPLDFALKIPYG